MNWNEISVKQYYEILDILREESEDDAISLNARLIDCIWGIDSADIPVIRFSWYINELEFLQNPYKPKIPKKEYTFKGITFIPNENIC
jgi:hypothetical protein